MATVEGTFGANAGKVWDALNISGSQTVKALAKSTKLKETDVMGALGWLAREGKVNIIVESNQTKFQLQ